jgi:hypothetical protein
MVAAVLGFALLGDNHDPAYVGTTKEITLAWGGCAAVTYWRPPGVQSYSWWADSEPNFPRDAAAPHNARGEISFTSRSHATFRSETGWTLRLHRESNAAFHVLGCPLG